MIIGAMLVRNEAGRYLERVLEQMRKVCDEIVVVDDGSTDGTSGICKEQFGAKVRYISDGPRFERDELFLRESLWSMATFYAENGDWILCLDADETIVGIERLPEVIKLAEQHGAGAIGFRLYDMWNETQYRDDEHWTAHRRLWPLCVRYDVNKEYRWNEQPLHCGRFPVNAAERIADAHMDVQHWGWSRQADRERKYEFYKRIDKGGYGNAAQYESILDPNPKLKQYGEKRVLIGSPVHQREQIFRLYLDSLTALDTEGLALDWAFIFHNCRGLADVAKSYHRHILAGYLDDEAEYRCDDETHHWENENFSAVTRMRNSLLQATIAGNYDYLFMVDSDLILHPQTLRQLIKADKPIVSEVFWTRWATDGPEMPNAWMYDQYYFDALERIEQWREPGLHKVGMTGACTLIRSDVIKAGVNYNPIPNISWTNWEDRAFCIRAAVHGFEIWMDTTYPAKHLYRESDVQEVLNRDAAI